MFKNLLYLAILTAVVVASWIGLSVYHSYTTSTISQDTLIIITPIPQEFDREVIAKIKQKKIVQADLRESVAEISETEATGGAAQRGSAPEGAKLPATSSAQVNL